ncbi:MAG: LL-diaminopimelate aminotransferase [Anaerolineales bacterium]
MKIADRINNLPPYVFATVEKKIAAQEAKGVDVINLGIGSPDLAPPDFIVETLCRSAARPDTHGYAGYYGTPDLRQAIATYYKERFDVEVNPETEIRPLIGSKEGLANMALAFVDPDDLALAPVPGYPTYRMGAILADGGYYAIPLLEEDDYLVDFEEIPEDIASRSTILWLNYPNNPTGAVATEDFLQEAVDFAKEYDIVLCYDNPYCDLTFDGYRAPSILETPGAKDITVEFNSLSKTYNMAGWRVGMAVGNAEAIGALTTVKTNIDSGIFRPIQDAAAVALTSDQTWIEERNMVYQRRRDIILDWLPDIGMSAQTPKGGLYVWAKVPENTNCDDFAITLLEKAGVWITPGTAFGKYGEGYMRISLCVTEERLREAGERLSDI